MGVIITYQTNNSREIVDINNYLFGRVAIINRNNLKHYYYYEGILSDIPYYKLSNGCYYIDKDIRIINSNIKIINNITITEETITAREYFKNKYKDIRVKNLG